VLRWNVVAFLVGLFLVKSFVRMASFFSLVLLVAYRTLWTVLDHFLLDEQSLATFREQEHARRVSRNNGIFRDSSSDSERVDNNVTSFVYLGRLCKDSGVTRQCWISRAVAAGYKRHVEPANIARAPRRKGRRKKAIAVQVLSNKTAAAWILRMRCWKRERKARGIARLR